MCDIRVMSEPESVMIVAGMPFVLPPIYACTVVAFAPRKEQPGGQDIYLFMKIGVPGGASA